ncbi:MAG TPA: sugar phosphate isomerase/epimerase family protein [Gemmataceae bacterium]|nr:sugar phosphate isomerase/epimerase family protein [Gemmataceae bacterium]
MRFVYFTKLLRGQDIPGIIAFLKDVGVDGADLAVRPGYPVTPDNAAAELPKAAKAFRDAGLVIGLVTAPTDLTDAGSAAARTVFEAAARAGVPAVKIGYFPYRGKFDAELAEARRRLAGFAKLAERTGVKACYHPHSGNDLGNNAAGLRLLLRELDPHHVGAFVDTGHTAINGGPIRYELDIVRPWLSLLAIKDMAWEKAKGGWQYHVVPAGEGIVRWDGVAAGLKDVRFNGTVSLHGEYETKDLDERKALARRELALLRKVMG